MQLVDRVLEVEPAQQRIGRDFGRAQDVATAVGFDFAERSAASGHADRDRSTPTCAEVEAVDPTAPIGCQQTSATSTSNIVFAE